MGKPPAFQFYPNDWSRDLEEHPLEIEGAWVRICCKLWWSETRGQLKRTDEQWAKILRIDQNECNRILNYIETWKIGDISHNGNGEVTVMSRRMLRDEIDRNNNALRQQRFKAKRKGNGSVTPSVTAKSHRSSSSSSSSSSKNKRISKSHCEDRNPHVKEFISFYCISFKEKFGTEPEVEWGKDSAIIKNLLKRISLEEMRELLGRFFDSEDSFIIKSGYTIGIFKSQINKLKIGEVSTSKFSGLKQWANEIMEEENQTRK